MKKKFTFLMAACVVLLTMLFAVSNKAVGQTRDYVLHYTLDGTITATGSAYATATILTQNGIGWSVVANTEQNPWRIGGKGITNQNREIKSTTAMGSAITKIDVSVGATVSSLTVNSIKLIVASNATFSEVLDEITKTSNLTSTTLTFTPTSGTEWETGAYYKIVFNVTRTSTSGNGYVTFNFAKFYNTSGGGSNPSCSITPTTWNFGTVVTGSTQTKQFTVTTANLTGNLTVAIDNTDKGFSVSPTSIGQNETSKTITVTYNPKTAHAATTATLTISDGGLTSNTTASITGTAADEKTITFNAGSGSCNTPSYAALSGTSYDLPVATPSPGCVASGWVFAGWSIGSVSEMTTAPETLFNGSYTITDNVTLYAVYSYTDSSGSGTSTFNFATIASNESWENGEAYTPVVIGQVTLAGNGGGNNAKYYTSDDSWRMYNGGTVNITTTNNNVTSVTSTPSKTFTISNGAASLSCTETIKFTQIVVAYGFSTTTYNSNPSCVEAVATPTFTPAPGNITTTTNVTISCETPDATIYYTTNGDTPTTDSDVYSDPIPVSATTTIKAMAVKAEMTNSVVAVGEYVFVVEYTYNLATSITPGKHYIIVSNDASDNYYAMGGQSGDYRVKVDISVTANSTTIDSNAGVSEVVISGDEFNGYTLHATDGYLAGGSKTLKNNGTSSSTWTISFSGNVATISTGSYAIKYNSSSPRFNCYDSGQRSIYLYEKDGDNDCHIYSNTTLSSTNKITVPANGILTVNGDYLTNDEPANLIIEDGGQLIIPSAKTDVKATFQRDITGYGQSTGKDYYYLIANPTTEVEGINPDDVGMLDNNYDLYYFDESIPGIEWRNYKKVPFKLFNGKGYLYANSSSFTIEFPGTVLPGTTANITLSKSENGTYKGFNLVGNPLSNNITSMNIEGAECDYYKLDSEGSFVVSNKAIIVGEAFMVEAPNNGDKLYLNTTPPPSGKDEAGFTNEVIRLEVSNSKFTDVAYVYFGNHLPLTKINHLNDEAPMLYIHNENSDKAVEVYNNRGEVKSINVNFEAKTIGTYTISAKMVKGEIKYMHLYDRFTGIDTDLLIDDYSFIGANEDQPGRFILKLEAIDNEFEGSDNFAYQSGNNIMVNGEGELQIFDVMGRMVMNERINGVESISGLSRGIYIFRVIGETQKTQKIVVR